MATFLITGAPRGFGLALAHELASLPASKVGKIIASARGDAPALGKLAQNSSGRVVVVKLDVTDQASIKKVAAEVESELEGKGLDVLINNAGICQYALAGVKSISTSLGSITQARAAAVLPAPSYKISKAAMNALTVQCALDYEKEGFTFMALCPGWMKTDLGGGDMTDLTPKQGAKASLDIIFSKGQELNGQMRKVFFKGWEKAGGMNMYDGTNVPW